MTASDLLRLQAAGFTAEQAEALLDFRDAYAASGAGRRALTESEANAMPPAAAAKTDLITG